MARLPPIWQRLGFKSQYAYRRATGKYTPGTTGAERAREVRGAPALSPAEAARRARREARRRAAERPAVAGAPRVSWRAIPGTGGRYTETYTPEETRDALEAAAADGRRVIIHIHGNIIFRYPDPRDPRVATISEVPASIVLAFIGSGDAWIGLIELALRQIGRGYEAIEDVEMIVIKSYP